MKERDDSKIKPANILVNAAAHPKVIDFGVARATDVDIALTTAQTDAGQLIGTLQYMSPEQCDADPHDLDTRTDVYSLGIVLFELLTGTVPYDTTGTTIYTAARMIKEQEPPRLSSLNRKLRGDIENVVSKTIAKDREHRYQSAGDLARDLRRVRDREPVEAKAPTAWTRVTRWAARHPVGTTALASAAVAVLVLASAALTLWWGMRLKTGVQSQCTSAPHPLRFRVRR